MAKAKAKKKTSKPVEVELEIEPDPIPTVEELLFDIKHAITDGFRELCLTIEQTLAVKTAQAPITTPAPVDPTPEPPAPATPTSETDISHAPDSPQF